MARPSNPPITITCLCGVVFQIPYLRRNRNNGHHYCCKACPSKRGADSFASRGAKERWQKPEQRRDASNAAKQRWQDPAQLKHISEVTTIYWQDPQNRAAASTVAKKAWLDDARHKAHSARVVHNFRGGKTGLAYARFLVPVGFVQEFQIRWGPNSARDHFNLDFAHPELKINVELDGPGHIGSPRENWERDEILRHFGWIIVRVPHD